MNNSKFGTTTKVSIEIYTLTILVIIRSNSINRIGGSQEKNEAENKD